MSRWRVGGPMCRVRRTVFAVLAGALVWSLSTGEREARAAEAASGETFPAFYSLKSNPVNLRKGPGVGFPKTWVFRREGLPVEVLREHDRWREVRDSDGETGWILRTLLSRRRTALVTPWQLAEQRQAARGGAKPKMTMTLLQRTTRSAANPVARLEPGTLVSIASCDLKWCEVSIDNFRGFVRQNKLWGVYPDEQVR